MFIQRDLIMPIESIVKTLSATRLSTYMKDHLCDASLEQSLGLYVWNKQLSGLFYPVLQVLEVSLRNAIYRAYIEDKLQEIETNYPQSHWENEKNNIDALWFKSIYTANNNRIGFNQIVTAERDLIKDGKAITADNLIAKLSFGFWVHMTDIRHRAGNPKTVIDLWPNLTRHVFPNAFDLKDDGVRLSINNISSSLFEISKLRNRIAHHEPIWKGDDLYDSDDAINKVVAQYELCLKVISWINPNNLKLLSIIENDKQMGIACSQHTLWRNKMLAMGLASVPILSGWQERHQIDCRLRGEVVHSNLFRALIKCDSSGKIFYTTQSMQNRKRTWPLLVGSKQTFIPKPSANKYADATQVKP